MTGPGESWSEEGRPDERRTLARQVHDGPLQSATALDLRLQLLVLRYPEDADAVAALGAAEGLVTELRALESTLRAEPAP